MKMRASPSTASWSSAAAGSAQLVASGSAATRSASPSSHASSRTSASDSSGSTASAPSAAACVVTHLTVDTRTGKVGVAHVWAAQDCGLTVNPDGMRAQAEGCVVQGISRALLEEVRWTPQGLTSVDWVS